MRSSWYYFGGLACWFLALFFYLQPRLWRLEWGYPLGEMHERVLHQEDENRALRAERSRLRSIQRIERIAREELGMILPKEEQIILIGAKDR